jgi:predicted dienelactone hydrolase
MSPSIRWLGALAVFCSCATPPARQDSKVAPGAAKPAPTAAARVHAARTQAPHHVGHRRLDFGRNGQRTVKAELWYPVSKDIEEQPKAYILTHGRSAEAAPLAPGLPERLPLVLVSPGSGGSGSDLAWLTELLAANGYLVLGIHHYQESLIYGIGSVNPRAIFHFARRVGDLLFAHQMLQKDPEWSGRLDPERLFGAGHSAGAHTLLASAGLEFSERRLFEYCAASRAGEDKGCAYAERLGAREIVAEPHEVLTTPLGYRGLLLLDPALGPSFPPEALAAFETNVQIVATKPGDFLPFTGHANYYASKLPNSGLMVLDQGEGHFVFLGECSLALAVEGVSLCADADGVDRFESHERILSVVVPFFAGLS